MIAFVVLFFLLFMAQVGGMDGSLDISCGKWDIQPRFDRYKWFGSSPSSSAVLQVPSNVSSFGWRKPGGD